MTKFDEEYQRQLREYEYQTFHNISVIPQHCAQYLVTAHNRVWQYIHQKMRESEDEQVRNWSELMRHFDKDIAFEHGTSLFFLEKRKIAVIFDILDNWKLEDTFRGYN